MLYVIINYMSSDYDIEVSLDETIEIDTIIEKWSNANNSIDLNGNESDLNLSGLRKSIGIINPKNPGEYTIKINGQNLKIYVRDPNQIPSSGVARWDMNSGSGDVIDRWGDHNLNLQDSTFWETSYEGIKSLKFERSNSEYAQTITDDIWSTISSNNSITVMGWVYVFREDEQYASLIQNTPPNNGDETFRFSVNGTSNKNHLLLTINGNDVSESNSKLETNKWIHVAASYNGSTGKVYKNGNIKSSNSFSTSIDDKNKMYFGARTAKPNPDWYDGGMDYWEIHNKQLTDTEVNNHYNYGTISGS